MTKPTPEQIDTWSQVDFGTLGYPDIADIQPLIDRAWAWLAWASGHTAEMGGPLLDAWTDAAMEPLVQQAVQAKTEGLAYQGRPDVIETAADFMLIGSFSAGSYSETRRSIKDLQMAGMIDADPRINSLLWPLMTADMRDLWMSWLTGKNPPAFEVTEMDWGAGYSGYDSWDDLMNARISTSEPWQSYF